jgi:23S rRNA (uracil1939-C5)-methyltransferase
LRRSDDTFRVKVEVPAYGGYAIARNDGAVVFVRGAIPGETVDISIDEQKKDYSFATATNIVTPSPDRTMPQCRVFGICSGCSLQFINYPGQIAIKEEILRDSIRRTAKIEVAIAEPLLHDNPWHYRHRGQFKISGSCIGFYKEKSRDIVDITECPLMIREINDLLAKTSAMLKPDTNLFRGTAEFHVTCGNDSIGLIKTRHKPADAPKLASALLNIGFSGICIETEHARPLWFGERNTAFELEGLKYSVSPQSFIQSHWKLNQKVVRHLKTALHPVKIKKLVDLYCGGGNFTLPLSMIAEEVIGIEENASAIEDGKRNAKLNDIHNCRFVKSVADQFKAEKADALVVDPPRPGLTNMAMNKILAMSPERIVYVSCNPSTFARDLKKLLVKYEIESIRLIDFFPQTYHIESMAFLGLR